jgi:RNA polymerase sigma-70 factor (ECF subfamily)
MSITPIPRTAWREDAPSEPACGSGEAGPSPIDSTDDLLLAAAISRGEARALDILITRYWTSLTTYIARIVNDMALAEDVVQRTFLGVWRDRLTWSPRSVRAYLFRAARNTAFDELRGNQARARRELGVSRDDERVATQPDAVLEETRIADAVNDAIGLLPERRREAFTLIYLKGLTYEEAASVMGISTKTIGHHVSAALAELRMTLRHLLFDATRSSTGIEETVHPIRPSRPPRS